jgi:hypothetical protein
MKRVCTVLVSSLAALPVLAHEGHGAAAIHWHATDTAGFLMVAVLAGIAVWLSRGE